MDESRAALFTRKMTEIGMPPVAVASFLRALQFVDDGGETQIPEASIHAVSELPTLETLADYEAAGVEALDSTVVIKLNGGLGTSMGLSGAKSLLPVRDGATFLDLIARQILIQRADSQSEIPFLLMNSYRTREDTLAALQRYPELRLDGLPIDFVQHRVPRVGLVDDGGKGRRGRGPARLGDPIEWPADSELEWCPPGHGDLYIALESQGMLDDLLDRGIRYAFVSNADNLGAVLEPRILGWLAREGLPFVMEVAERTEADRKGGHLAERAGRFVLRETAQCPEADRVHFEDVSKHRFFNTNNLWLDLFAVVAAFDHDPAGPVLPVIRNEKRVDPDDPKSPRCLQLETAMGSAIECFDGARALVVPRTRFAPVKTTNDLLAVWSDAYRLTPDHRLVPAAAADPSKCVIQLDPRFFGRVEDLVTRFPAGPPSLAKCRRFSVTGDFVFGGGVVVEGEVELADASGRRVEIEAGSVLRG